MMFIFPNWEKYVIIQPRRDSVKFSIRMMQKILDLLSCDLTTSKDQSYQAESAWYMIEMKSLMRGM